MIISCFFPTSLILTPCLWCAVFEKETLKHAQRISSLFPLDFQPEKVYNYYDLGYRPNAGDGVINETG